MGDLDVLAVAGFSPTGCWRDRRAEGPFLTKADIPEGGGNGGVEFECVN